MNLYEEIGRSLRRTDKIVLDDQRRPLTGPDLDWLAARFAGVLAARGVAAGDRVAAQVAKSPEAVALYLACLRLGAAYLPLNTGYSAAELEYFLGDAEPRVLVADLENPRATLTLDAAGEGSLPAAAREAAPFIATTPREDGDLAAICYTSGTTGRSKGAMISHANLLSNARALIQIWGLRDTDTLLHALPIYHMHGLFVALHCALLSGAAIIFQSRFEVGAVIEALPRATLMMGVPTFYTRLLAEPRFGRALVKHMRLFVSGSAPLLPDTFEAFAKRTGHRILERYGMTETGIIASNRLDRPRQPGSVGWALPGLDLRIVDDHGMPVEAGRVGSVEVSGPSVFAGYWRQPEKTRAEFRDDGFFVTGDLGRFGAEGDLCLTGRAKDLIISGGLNVYPIEVEAALDALDAIEESAVIGLPHPDLGETVVAVAVLREGYEAEEAELIRRLREDLAGFKTPKRIFLVESLPRNAMGKVQKALLREIYGGSKPIIP